MKGYYTIQTHKSTPLGFVVGILSLDGKYYQATNTAVKFRSVKEASRYFWDPSNPIELICTGHHIRGPRGGYYKLMSKHECN